MARYYFDMARARALVGGNLVEVPRRAVYAPMARRRGADGVVPEYALPAQAGAEVTSRMRIGDLELPHVRMSCTMSKRIVTTAINGRPGTVKEWVSDGDVVVTLTVVVMSEDDGYPKAKVKEVLDKLRESEVQKVENEQLNDVWGVTRVVVTSIKLSGRTERNMEEIEVGLLSDEAYIVTEETEA